jgi:hypothetical protein
MPVERRMSIGHKCGDGSSSTGWTVEASDLRAFRGAVTARVSDPSRKSHLDLASTLESASSLIAGGLCSRSFDR